MHTRLEERCREIFVKAVCAKGRAASEQVHLVRPPRDVVDVLGCRVTGLRFGSRLRGDFVRISGEYELQIWVAYDGDSELLRQRVDFHEDVALRDIGEGVLDDEPEVVAEAVRGPTVLECTVTKDGRLEVTVSVEFRVDVVGRTRLRVRVCDAPDDGIDADDVLFDDTLE
ncbi:MAG: outer spore coat protein CotE [Thermaerobacter sp.]|nr:hypothetical protein [Bacillota bacterium]REJ38427.1 MAG: hypothetical protein DIU84_00040 [Bacillota bacterium]